MENFRVIVILVLSTILWQEHSSWEYLEKDHVKLLDLTKEGFLNYAGRDIHE